MRRHFALFGVALLLHLVQVVVATAAAGALTANFCRWKVEVDSGWHSFRWLRCLCVTACKVRDAIECSGEEVRLEGDLCRQDLRMRDQLLCSGIWTG